MAGIACEYVSSVIVMAEALLDDPLLDDLRVDARLERDRRVRVAQIVQPDLRQPGVAHVVIEGP